MRRDDICFYVGSADRAPLQAMCASRNTPRTGVWRAEIMRRAAASKPTVWRSQVRYLDEGVAGLKPHLTRRFKATNDPLFEEKVSEIVKLYLDPPERAVVL